MSKKDFIAIAQALRETNATPETVRAIARYLSTTNPRFRVETFISAATP